MNSYIQNITFAEQVFTRCEELCAYIDQIQGSNSQTLAHVMDQV